MTENGTISSLIILKSRPTRITSGRHAAENRGDVCKIESKDDQNISVSFKNEGLVKFNGNITLKDIYEKLPVFEDYTMKELFEILIELKDDKFQIIKENDKYKLNILIKVLNKEKTLSIDITEVTQSEDDLIKFLINEVKSQEERISNLENELKKLKESSS